ncbi:MAG: hypothetical protein U0359_33765 [Byssovorax sp.]
MNRSLLLSAAALAAISGLSRASFAEEPAPVAAPPAPPPAGAEAALPPPSAVVAADAPAPAEKASARGVEINLAFGFRGAGYPNAGFDPYGENDFVGQLMLAAGPTVYRSGKFSLATIAEWDVGSSRATARGDASRITLHRLAVSLESRYQLIDRLGLFVKLAPGAYHLRATIEDPGSERPLVSRTWTYSLDATGGASFMFARVGTKQAPKARFFFTGEMGYGFAGTSEMVFAPTEDAEDPKHYGTLKLPDFRPAGPVGRLAFAVAF